ncbi:MAG TPA: DUF2341 domain-containing protein [Verrucomicrobiae bacterium]|nr:DUF2341 domain-containing protein [Verrucomicrobiae bacterium]
MVSGAVAAPLATPQVDAYDVRVGTETFSPLYKFTTNTALVETANVIQGLGSDVIKFYLGSDTTKQSGLSLTSKITNLVTLARDEPSYRKVFDMPFRNFVFWAYPFSNPDAPFQNGYTTAEANNDYREIYDLTRYLLTNYNGSGKTFYLGHWEGDGYFAPWSTNPTPTAIQGMIGWLNNRQKAVDDAKRATPFHDVMVYNYAECNRVRDAMVNPPTSNERVINMVIPYVTNLDYVSYSSYDAQNLSLANMTATLDYIEARIPTNKASVIPGERLFIGEYGFANSGNNTAQQEPLTRSYIQRLLNYGSKGFRFILFWEVYNNEPGLSFELIDSNNVAVPNYFLHQRFINQARLLTARFNETNGRLPNDAEYVGLVTPTLNQPFPAPISLSMSSLGSTVWNASTASITGSLVQGIYGDDQAVVRAFWGRQNGGNNASAWENSALLGVNTNFNATAFSTVITNLAPGGNYFFTFEASNATTTAWAPVKPLSTAGLNPPDFSHRLKITFPGFQGSAPLTNFPALVSFSANTPGFSYGQFASPTGGDLRFADSGGLTELPYEMNQWNPAGTSTIWVLLPSLASATDSIWAYWGNPAATNPPAYTTNGAVWQPNHIAVWHLEQGGFPYLDSAGHYPIAGGVAPAGTAGWIGEGQSFNSDYLDAGAVNLGNTFTLSAWFYLPPGVANIQTLFANKHGGWNTDGVSLYVDTYNTSDRAVLLETGDGTGGVTAQSPSGAISDGHWHFVAATVDRVNGVGQIYVDGVNQTQSNPVQVNFANQADLNLGRFTDASFPFRGLMDEVRITAGLATPDWIQAAWMNTASNATFAAFSAINPQPSLLLLSSAAGATVTWPADTGVYELFSATNLAPPVTWEADTNTPQLINGQWQLSLSSTDATRFYRLQAR